MRPFSLLLSLLPLSLAVQNDRPIIGILTLPNEHQSEVRPRCCSCSFPRPSVQAFLPALLQFPGASYFPASYVKWIESAGARVAPIKVSPKNVDHVPAAALAVHHADQYSDWSYNVYLNLVDAQYTDSASSIAALVSSLNGVLFTGGGAEFVDGSGNLTPFAASAKVRPPSPVTFPPSDSLRCDPLSCAPCAHTLRSCWIL